MFDFQEPPVSRRAGFASAEENLRAQGPTEPPPVDLSTPRELLESLGVPKPLLDAFADSVRSELLSELRKNEEKPSIFLMKPEENRSIP